MGVREKAHGPKGAGGNVLKGFYYIPWFWVWKVYAFAENGSWAQGPGRNMFEGTWHTWNLIVGGSYICGEWLGAARTQVEMFLKRFRIQGSDLHMSMEPWPNCFAYDSTYADCLCMAMDMRKNGCWGFTRLALFGVAPTCSRKAQFFFASSPENSEKLWKT